MPKVGDQTSGVQIYQSGAPQVNFWSYLSPWILHNLSINNPLDSARLFNKWLIYLPLLLWLLFLTLHQLFKPTTLKNHIIPQSLLVTLGCWSSWVDIHTELGVYHHVFYAIIDELHELGHSDSKFVTLEEQLAIFLYCYVTGLTVRHLGEWFQRSNDTITL